MTTKIERQVAIQRIREDNERGFGTPARTAVQKMLDSALPSPWMYVYELTQNALDAGAQRISWQPDDDGVLFQHDGHKELDESHVRGIASLGASTKGLDAVGFMGIGFKSVFARFHEARVSGFGWGFRFDIPVRTGALGITVPEWFNTLLPRWDDDSPLVEESYTTAFLLGRPADRDRSLAEDFRKLASLDDPTPLAVLAIRGLRQMRIGKVTWNLTFDGGTVTVSHSEADTVAQWRVFISNYRPSDAAMRRFLRARQELQDQTDEHGCRIQRAVVGLIPLDSDGRPKPPTRGRVYSTLPTRTPNPLGFHIQADWLVNIGRQEIRDVDADPWQEAIVRRIPELVQQMLLWLSEGENAERSAGYRALRHPKKDDGPLARPLRAIKEDFVTTLADAAVVPIHGESSGQCRTPDQVTLLPSSFREAFGSRWRPDLLFGLDLMNETLLGRRATNFARWLGWGREIAAEEVVWTETLPEWWRVLPPDEQTAALFALWQGVSKSGWNQVPVVPTEAGDWTRANATVWLNEAPPTEREPGGSEVLGALASHLPSRHERLPSRLRRDVARDHGDGTRWLRRLHREEKLSSVVREACESAVDPTDLPLVSLVEWALHRGENRRDLVPRVLTEKGARKPTKALLADPLVEGGRSRRALFQALPALVEGYAQLDNRDVVVRFLRGLGVRGGALKERRSWVSRYGRSDVAEQIGVDVGEVKKANDDGYRVIDHSLPFAVEDVPPDALQDWLSHEHSALLGKGRRKATRSYFYDYAPVKGRAPATWVQTLEEHPWLLCTDGKRRRPAETLIEADPDFEDAPIADMAEDLASRLTAEGVRFGADVPKSPVMRRLKLRGGADLPDPELAALLHEATAHVETGDGTREELLNALGVVRVHEVPLLGRVVHRAGSGSKLRSDLGWVVALSDVESSLADAIGQLPVEIPQTTTGRQALDFLLDVWSRTPSSVEDLRGHLAPAYRYVLEDLESGLLPADDWWEARAKARLYGRRRWHPVSPTLAVDDVQSPLILQFLSKRRVTVASAHLGETADQVHRVAEALGLSLLSDDVSVAHGTRVAPPPWATQLRRLLDTLARLEDRRPLHDVAFLSDLHIEVSGDRHPVHAYVEDATLLLAGGPRDFGVEAAGQIVEYFQLGQRGTEIPWLTGALFSLGNERQFTHALQVLADGLGVDPVTSRAATDDEPTRRKAKDEPGVDPPRAPVNATPETNTAKPSASPNAEPDRRGTPGSVHRGDPDTENGHKNVPPLHSPPRAPRAADHFGIMVVREGKEKQDSSSTGSDRSGTFRDDHKARRAVIRYETHCGRRAEAMDDLQPGFDVRSTDEATGHKRLIEVKGVQGTFRDDASVVLTARQAHDAVTHAEDGVEYWLYVVDSTETDHPRVFPIPWVRRPARLRYGFYAKVWANAAERPAVVTEDGLTDLPSQTRTP